MKCEKIRTAALVLLAIPMLARCSPPDRPPGLRRQTVVLISIDGFKPEYLDSFPVPNLRALAARGVRARWMEPSTPSVTFPNHYTIVTGLYPAHHGIVNNTIVDPVDGARFTIGDRRAVTDSRWWGGEPIWSTAERQGVRTATYFWPGSEAEIAGRRPSRYKRYLDAFPNSARVDSVLAWITHPDRARPRLVTLYFSLVDHESHSFGPWSRETRRAIVEVDDAVGQLVRGLDGAGLTDSTNIVVVSDHGMADTPPEQQVVLDDYFPRDSLRIVQLSPFLSVSPRGGSVPDAIARLRRVPHLSVFARDSTPAHWHYTGNPRIPAIVGVMDEGWDLTLAGRDAPPPGNHGFDVTAPSMRATFVAAGPAIAQGRVIEPFSNVHVYELLCTLLGVRPAPNDGSPDSLRAVLR